MDSQLSMTPLSVSLPTFKKIVGGVFVCLFVFRKHLFLSWAAVPSAIISVNIFFF